jgi:hypothetical protein
MGHLLISEAAGLPKSERNVLARSNLSCRLSAEQVDEGNGHNRREDRAAASGKRLCRSSLEVTGIPKRATDERTRRPAECLNEAIEGGSGTDPGA